MICLGSQNKDKPLKW